MNQSAFPKRIKLGATNIDISPLGIGIWAWGARYFWGYGKEYTETDLRETYNAIIAAGINFFDTAEVYGMGVSERTLGKFAKDQREQLVVATKWFPFPWRVDPWSQSRALRRSLRRLQMEQADLYQVHMPIPPYRPSFWVKRIAKTFHAGLTKSIGVSNFNLEQTQQAQKILATAGISLASNQLRYSIIDREIEKNGLLDYCQENNISVIAYSPLAMGMLTGKYTPDSPPKGVRQSTYRYTPEFLTKIIPLLNLIREIGQSHDDATPAQVALNWTMCKGTVPIPGAKNIRQAKDNIRSLQWRLSDDEISAIDEISDEI